MKQYKTCITHFFCTTKIEGHAFCYHPVNSSRPRLATLPWAVHAASRGRFSLSPARCESFMSPATRRSSISTRRTRADTTGSVGCARGVAVPSVCVPAFLRAQVARRGPSPSPHGSFCKRYGTATGPASRRLPSGLMSQLAIAPSATATHSCARESKGTRRSSVFAGRILLRSTTSGANCGSVGVELAPSARWLTGVDQWPC